MRCYLACVFLLFTATSVSALERLHDLTVADYPLGEHRYLVYIEDKASGNLKSAAIWQRNVSEAEYQGQAVIKTEQHWRSPDGKSDRDILSYNRIDNFQPLYHRSHSAKGDEAFVFTEQQIVGDAHLANNQKADFSLRHQPGLLNWELDMETFALLELNQQQSVTLPFYHPGSKTEPALYTYQVSSKDYQPPYGAARPCWVLRYSDGEKYQVDFWLDKSSGQVIYMQEQWGNTLRYKIKIS
ncbi:hypothetical protein KJY73_15860 [Bowmanella sp. Y26]|uniref:DUF3108 domain-containing protein n=1 Tax=Bowmanella yangjiangensis TaxID=2811230 RepID=UPI001BDBD047|nr:hypothetical protein [Bowmanella yangjiangensis]MBT1065068.1 hypothetical protein [Bowmanella yangjiangensis]